jgi:uncharacterized protein DUF4304
MHRRLHHVKMQQLLTAQDTFRAMMREQIAPALRELGFKGSGQVYLLPSGTHWAMLSFQKSAYSDAERIRFAVNFDVTTKEEWEHRRRAFGAPARPSPSWLHNRSIADQLLPGGGWMQHWWHLRINEPVRPLVDDVVSRIEHEALPAMRAAIAQRSG